MSYPRASKTDYTIQMANIGIYGGSFNPVHYGHIGLARWVVEHTDLDEVWLVVSPNNPLKPAGLLAPEQERLSAVRNAIKDIPGLVASDFEFSLPRPSYTADTLRALQAAYPQHDFTLIIGEDNIAIFNQWKEYTYILENFRIFVYPRRGSVTGHRSPITHAKEVRFLVNAPLFDISSTAIRRSQGRS